MSLKLTETQASLLFALEPSSKIYKPVRQRKARRRFFGLAPALAYGTRHQWDHKTGRALQRWWRRHGWAGTAWIIFGLTGLAGFLTHQNWTPLPLVAATIAAGIDLFTPRQRRTTMITVKDTALAHVIAEHMTDLPKPWSWYVRPESHGHYVELKVRDAANTVLLHTVIKRDSTRTTRGDNAWVNLRELSRTPQVHLEPDATAEGVKAVLAGILDFLDQTRLLREDPQRVRDTPVHIERQHDRDRTITLMSVPPVAFGSRAKYAVLVGEPRPFRVTRTQRSDHDAADLWRGWLAAWLALDKQGQS